MRTLGLKHHGTFENLIRYVLGSPQIYYTHPDWNETKFIVKGFFKTHFYYLNILI